MSARLVLDLFAGGCGGWSLGLHRAGYQTVAACEIDPWRRAQLARNFPGARLYGDVRDLTAARLLADLGYLPGVIVGSPPCQDASVARRGNRTGIAGERTGLFWEALRLVRELRPRWVGFENVVGLNGVGHDELASALEADGYQVWTLDMGAEDFGATHKRRRLWLIAMADAEKGRLEDARRQSGTAGADWLGSAVGGLQAPGNPWRQGEGDPGRLADGFPAGVAGTKVVGAYGDAVIPQIPEAIGRVMARLLPDARAA